MTRNITEALKKYYFYNWNKERDIDLKKYRKQENVSSREKASESESVCVRVRVCDRESVCVRVRVRESEKKK